MKPEVDRGHVRCATYWGTHGCSLIRGHQGDCKCECCGCADHQADPQDGCVGSAPYYGSETRFYGEDADWVTDEAVSREETLARFDETSRRDIAQAHRGEVVPGSGVPVEPKVFPDRR